MVVLEAKGGDSKEGIVTIHIPDAQSQNTLAAEHLQGIVEIIESVRCDVIIRERHKENFLCIHHVRKIGMSDG